MSVTFFLETSTAEYMAAPALVECECPGASAHVFVDGHAAWQWCEARNAMPEEKRPVPFGCKDPELCRAYNLYPTAQLPWIDYEINMTGQNAAFILEHLGLVTRPVQDRIERAEHTPEDPFTAAVLDAAVLDVDLCGHATGQDFLGRVLIALALAPFDEGTPTLDAGRVVAFGRPEGYAQERLAQLRDLAEAAVRHGRTIAWS